MSNSTDRMLARLLQGGDTHADGVASVTYDVPLSENDIAAVQAPVNAPSMQHKLDLLLSDAPGKKSTNTG
jgi:hypothetical protein